MKPPFGSVVVEAAARLMAPFILLFGAYVIAHGHYSPGGGFQGGVLLAAALILVRLVRGHRGSWGLEGSASLALATVGLVLYAGIGFLAMVFGGAFLDYGALPLPLEPAHVRAAGTLGIEVGVGLSVMGVMILIFDSLIGWEQDD